MSVTLDTAKIINTINQAVREAVITETAIMEQDAKRFAPVRKVFSSKLLGTMTRTRRRRQLVGLSAAQLNAEADIRQRLGLGPGPTTPNTYRQVARRTLASEMLDTSWYSTLSPQMRRSTRSGEQLKKLSEDDPRLVGPRRNEKGELVLQKSAMPLLTARGRYELAHAEKRRALSISDSIDMDPSGNLTAFATEVRLGGRLRSEITALDVESDGSTFVGRVVSPTPYAKYVEFGTHHAPAQPYLRPAANLARRRFRKTLQRSLDGVGRKWRS